VVLCSLGANIREVFEVAGFLSIFNVHPDRAAATAALR
jgi:anti-anti-sigma regulatory factor